MDHLLQLSDAGKKYMAVLTLREIDVKKPAIDVFFDFMAAAPEDLAGSNILPAGQIDDLKALQEIIFDKDDQGWFIRESVNVMANGQPLDPERPLIAAFLPAQRDGINYFRCDMVVSGEGQSSAVVGGVGGGATAAPNAPLDQSAGVADQIRDLARILFLHEIAIGYAIDVTKDFPELSESIAEAEKNNWIEIDVKSASYKLTAEGKRVHDSYIAEAQELIKRYDIFSDVEIDSQGQIMFDTKLGRDWRIPVMEYEGVEPFRARFVLGINDGEWDELSDWPELYCDPKWYKSIFQVVERAPSLRELPPDTVMRLIDQGRAQTRADSRFRN